MNKLALVLTFFALACSHQPVREPAPVNPAAVKLKTVIDRYVEAGKRLDAFSAPYFNIEEDLASFGDYASPEYWERSKKLSEEALAGLATVNFEALPPADKLTYRLFKEDAEVSLAAFDFPFRYLGVDQMGNRLGSYMDTSNEAMTRFPFDTVAHYDAYVKRANGFPAYVDREIAQMREGIKRKITLSCVIADKVPSTWAEALEKNVDKNPFFRPIGFMPKAFSNADRERLTADYRRMITERILPAYQKFDAFYRREYRKHCSQGFGIGRLPRGEAWYAYSIRASTGLTLSPKEIHQTGLREVERITGEMQKIVAARGFKGGLKAFRKSITNDPNMYFGNAKEEMAAFEQLKARVNATVPRYFSVMPKADFVLAESSNAQDAAGSYQLPSETKPLGTFVMNTKNLKSNPKYRTMTLLLHEAVPGHHFQLALAFEMKDKLSEYQRKMFMSNAFVEGWALYAEHLGNEMGLFDDPLQRFGNLDDEMLRAVRLVVDTGIHAMGWSQKKATDYALSHLAAERSAVEIEINRYSVWPGQALGYKIGQLKILELRRKAEAELGPKFDIKGFHEAVIGNGTVSLGVLETQVDDWIKRLKSSNAQASR